MLHKNRFRRCALAALSGLALGTAAFAQSPDPSREVPLTLDSGVLIDPAPGAPPGGEARVVWAQQVTVAEAPWMRLHFSADTRLAGPDRHHGGSWLVVTSGLDGARHILDAATLPEWDRISAFMNGETMLIEVWAVPGAGDNRVRIETATVGIPPQGGVGTICGATDDRVPNNVPTVGRLSTGCTGWLINENGAANEFLTAGHCISNGQNGAVMMFNVPPATGTGGFVAPPPEFQFPVQAASIQQFDSGAVGDEYARFNTNNNSNTGLPARIAQGRGAYSLASAAPNSGTAATTVRGNGIVNDQGGIPAVPWQWNRINKSHTGAYAGRAGNRINYLADTDNANSGSPVSQIIGSPLGFEQAIGIHTDGFCPGGTNSGTAIDHPGLQAVLASPDGTPYPFDTAVSKALGTTFNSDNGGNDGGSIFFDVAVGPRSITVSHLFLNINRNGSTNNATATEDDDFFNFEVFVRPGTAEGFEESSRGWTKVADGAGMPRPEDSATLGALMETFTLHGSQSYGVAIIFDDGAGHAYTNGDGSNETYVGADLTITGISASNTRFGTNIASRVFNGQIGYLLNESNGQCLETLFAGNNGLSSGSTVFFDIDTGPRPISLTGLSTNVDGAGGADCTFRLYRTATTYVGKETNPGSWTLVATGSATSAAENSPTYVALSQFVNLNANAGYGLALNIQTDTGVGHSYTNGNGLNQNYGNADLTMTLGAATSGLFTGSEFSPRVWNGALCYGIDLATCTNTLVTHRPPDPEIGGFNSTPGGQEEADNFNTGLNNWSVAGGTFWAAYSNSNLPPPNQDMVVRFFEDNAGLPGSLVASRSVNNVPVVDTGLYMNAGGITSPIYQYDLTFAAVSLPSGRYWVSALGNQPGFTWAWARTNTNANAHAVRQGAGAWALSAGDFAFVLCGTASAPCYADCDQSTGVGVLDIFDFLCFQNRYDANDPYACNCDVSTGPNLCDIFDFLCFQNAYDAGCP